MRKKLGDWWLARPEWQKPLLGLAILPLLIVATPLILIGACGMAFYYLGDSVLNE